MLNYMRAELYKLVRRSYLWVTVLVFLALEMLLVGSYVFTNVNGNSIGFSSALSEVIFLLPVGSYFTVLSGEMGFAAQYQNGTLKNEVSFGIPRWRIYLGKLLAQVVAALICCFAALSVYAAACRLLLPGGREDMETLVLGAKVLLAALPIWLGVQALVCALLFLIRNGRSAIILAVLIYSALPLMLRALGLVLGGSSLGAALLQLYRWMPGEVLSGLTNVNNMKDPLAYFGKPWLVGAVWTAASTAVGLWGFYRKEIN